METKFPIFVFPTHLKFYLGARHTYRQILTLYNPYDFPFRFKVLSTSPNKYTVIDPDGSIRPRSCVDIVIRHTMPMSSNCNVLDKFRITMLDHQTKKLLGKRDVESKLLTGEPDTVSNDGDNFLNVPQGERSPDEQKTNSYPMHNYRSLPTTNTPNYLCIILGIICSVVLLWPTQQEAQVESKFIPSYLFITNTIKLVFAYILGLITMVVLKP